MGKGPHGIRTSSDGRYLYVDVSTANNVVVIDIYMLLLNEFQPNNRYLYVVVVMINAYSHSVLGSLSDQPSNKVFTEYNPFCYLLVKASIPPIIPSIEPIKKPPIPNELTMDATNIGIPHLPALSGFL